MYFAPPVTGSPSSWESRFEPLMSSLQPFSVKLPGVPLYTVNRVSVKLPLLVSVLTSILPFTGGV